MFASTQWTTRLQALIDYFCVTLKQPKTFYTKGSAPMTDVRNMPAYTPGDAARYLHIPISTVRCWCFGQAYKDSEGKDKNLPPVITPVDKLNKLLSFTNLVELHVLSLTRREYKVPMPIVRNTINFLRKELRVERPLAEQQLFTDRMDLFVEQMGAYMSASGSRQLQPHEIVHGYLERIERDKLGAPLKLFPLVRSLKDDPQQAPVIEIDPAIAFGRPVLAHTGIPVASLVQRWQAGESIASLAADYEQPADVIEEVVRTSLRAA
jgi:uncharacterized protein (DUF433 family)